MSMELKLLAFFAAISTITYLYFGIYVFILDKKTLLNRLFFLSTIILAFWSFCIFWVYTSNDIKDVEWWVKISFVSTIIFYALNLHLVLEITGLSRVFSRWIYLIYLPPLYFLYMNFKYYVLFENFYLGNKIWIFNFGNEFSKTGLFVLYSGLYFGLASFALFYHSIKVKTYRKKLQARVLLIALITALLFSAFENLLFPAVTSYHSSEAVPVFLLIWIFGIWYAMIKYKFMQISPMAVGKDIVNGIKEAVILLDTDLNIISGNSRIEEIIGMDFNKLYKKNISEIVSGADKLKEGLNLIKEKRYTSFSCRINFINSEGSKILMEIVASEVSDRFGDMIGIIIIGNEVKEIEQFKSLYRVTDREMEIIQGIITGDSNKDIANRLDLSENTVKSHISNIYNKIGVSNRVQLINTLKSFKMIPNREADISLLIFDKKKKDNRK